MMAILMAAALAAPAAPVPAITASGAPAEVVADFQPQLPGAPRIEWAQRPTQAQIDASIPDDGMRPHFAGITCHARSDGSLADCTVLRGMTSPGGYGTAAMGFVPQFRLAPASVPPAATVVTVVMRFGDL